MRTLNLSPLPLLLALSLTGCVGDDAIGTASNVSATEDTGTTGDETTEGTTSGTTDGTTGEETTENPTTGTTTTGTTGDATTTSTSDSDSSGSESEGETSSTTGALCEPVFCKDLMTRPDFFQADDWQTEEVCASYGDSPLNWAQAIYVAERGVEAWNCNSFSAKWWTSDYPELLNLPPQEQKAVACLEFLGQAPLTPLIDGIPEDWEEEACSSDIHPIQDDLMDVPAIQTRLPGFTENEFNPSGSWQVVSETRVSSEECFPAAFYDWGYEYGGVSAGLECRLHVIRVPHMGNVEEYITKSKEFPPSASVINFPLPDDACLSGYHTRAEVECQLNEVHVGAYLSSWGSFDKEGVTLVDHNLWKSRAPITVVNP